MWRSLAQGDYQTYGRRKNCPEGNERRKRTEHWANVHHHVGGVREDDRGGAAGR